MDNYPDYTWKKNVFEAIKNDIIAFLVNKWTIHFKTDTMYQQLTTYNNYHNAVSQSSTEQETSENH